MTCFFGPIFSWLGIRNGWYQWMRHRVQNTSYFFLCKIHFLSLGRPLVNEYYLGKFDVDLSNHFLCARIFSSVKSRAKCAQLMLKYQSHSSKIAKEKVKITYFFSIKLETTWSTVLFSCWQHCNHSLTRSCNPFRIVFRFFGVDAWEGPSKFVIENFVLFISNWLISSTMYSAITTSWKYFATQYIPLNTNAY